MLKLLASAAPGRIGARRSMTFVSSSRFESSTRRGRIFTGSRIKRPAESKSASLDAWDAQLAIMRRKDPPQPMGLRIALLIDAENITYKNVDGIMNEVEKLGVVQVRRIYADWTSENMRGWRQTVLTNALTPIHQFQSSQGKGNSDSALIIDAMDILFKNKDIESFCIVSSDADFTRLATKLREEGKLVLGIGSNYTPAPFVVACNRFVYLHNLTKEDADEDLQAGAGGQQVDMAAARKAQGLAPNPAAANAPLQMLKQQQPSAVSAMGKSAAKASTTAASSRQGAAAPAPGANVAGTAASTGVVRKPGKKLDLTLPTTPAIKRAIVMDFAAEAAGKLKSEPAGELATNNEKLLPLLTRAWSVVRQDSGWALPAHLNAELLRIAPDLDAAAFGKYTKLEELFEHAVQGFDVKRVNGKVNRIRRVMGKRNDVDAAEFDEDILEDEADGIAPPPSPPQQHGGVLDAAATAAVAGGGGTVLAGPTPLPSSSGMLSAEQELTQVMPLLTRAWSVNRQDSGWASFTHVNAELLRIAPEFDVSKYGNYTKLDEMLENTRGFQIKRNNRLVMVRRVHVPEPPMGEETSGDHYAAAFQDDDDELEEEAH